ncbi:MAG TPA: ABC transporter permease [Acidimicrobiales bacterium]|jgi:ABC-2 type transport system permease protein|nr:ABC transporter permease [Acidimicrobiales bacterium]
MAEEPANGSGTRADRDKVTRVVSAHINVLARLVEIWRSRELLVYLVRTEIKVKYKNSVLGLVWSMIAPAMTLAVYTVVFGVFLKNGIPNFVIFLFSGLLLWNFFQTGVIAATGVVVNNAGLVKKVSFPREILALAAIGSAGVFLFFQICVMAIFMVVVSNAPAWGLMWLLVVAFIPCVVLSAALALLLASVNVYLRDTQHLIEVLVGAAWFWACPIVYSYQATVSAKLSDHGITWLYFLNPMTPLVMTYQRVLYAKTGLVTLTTPTHPKEQLLPSWGPLTYVWADAAVLGVGLVLFFVGMNVFGRLAGNFAEEL